MSEAPRYASLQDYVRVVRRHRMLVIGVTVFFIVAAYVSSATQEAKYQAQASMAFRDISQDAVIFGENVLPSQAPAERAAANAELIESPQVARGAKQRLDTDLTADELRSRITTTLDIRTNLVDITGESTEAEFAAQMTNAFAEEVVQVRQQEVDELLERAADATREEIEDIEDRGADVFTKGAKALELTQAQQKLARIETLREIAEPASITQRATPPGSPASPKPGRNAVIGGIIGLLFGLIAAFVRESLDRKLRSAREVHDELGIPILGRVSATAFGLPGLAASATNGARKMSELDFEAFRMLRMNLSYLARQGGQLRSVLVTSGFPEEGKSTVSMSLASAAALAGQSVLLVECDLRRPSFARRLGINAEPGLTDYLTGTVGPKEILQVVDLHEPLPIGNGKAPAPTPAAAKLVCITAGSSSQMSAELLVSERFRAFLDKVERAYDLVVIDSSPMLAVVDPLELVPQVDGVLVCVRVQQTTRDQLRAAGTTLETLPDQPTGVVVTGFRRGDPDSYDYYYGY